MVASDSKKDFKNVPRPACAASLKEFMADRMHTLEGRSTLAPHVKAMFNGK